MDVVLLLHNDCSTVVHVTYSLGSQSSVNDMWSPLPRPQTMSSTQWA